MGKTVRKVNPRLELSIRRNRALDAVLGYANHEGYERRTDRILRGNDGAISYDKCQTASVDVEGGFKLNTWSECPVKIGKEVKKLRRKAGKNLIRAQLA